MSGYIRYFETGGKNMSFVIKDNDVWDKCNEIWDKIKKELNIKFHNMLVYDEKYIKMTNLFLFMITCENLSLVCDR